MYTVYSLPLHIQEEWTLCRMLSSRRDFITLRRGKYGRHTNRTPTHGLWWWYTWMNEMMTNQNKYRHNERHILTSTKITYSWSTARMPNVWAVKEMYTPNSRPLRCCASCGSGRRTDCLACKGRAGKRDWGCEGKMWINLLKGEWNVRDR